MESVSQADAWDEWTNCRCQIANLGDFEMEQGGGLGGWEHDDLSLHSIISSLSIVTSIMIRIEVPRIVFWVAMNDRYCRRQVLSLPSSPKQSALL